MKNLKLENVTKIYDPGKSYQVDALRGIDMELQSGRSYAIMGASGSGKSTLLNILGCLDRPTSGRYLWTVGESTTYLNKTLTQLRAKDIGFILQDYGLIDSISVAENCMAPCVFAGLKRRQASSHVAAALKQLGISDLAAREVGKLSGGQKQRAAIARAIVNRPQLILADEPTGALDSENSRMILDVLLSLVDSRSILVLATHDTTAARRCDFILRIRDGRIAAQERSSALPVEQDFSETLLTNTGRADIIAQ